jgi:hypothetical protein
MLTVIIASADWACEVFEIVAEYATVWPAEAVSGADTLKLRLPAVELPVVPNAADAPNPTAPTTSRTAIRRMLRRMTLLLW